MSEAVLDVHNVESTVMALSVGDKADTTQVMPTGNHAHVAYAHITQMLPPSVITSWD